MFTLSTLALRKPQTFVATTAALFFLLISLLSRTPAYAQTGAGEIWGHVADSSGQGVAKAAITVTDVGTGASRHLFTDGRGRFAVPALPAGRYEVTALHD